MSSGDEGKKAPKGPEGKLTPEEIIRGFQQLRDEQKLIISKVNELEADKKEHKLVIETLEGVDEDRRCFRLLGGVLVERTVKEVLPAMRKNVEQITKVVETLSGQLVAKNSELSDYRQKFGIKIVNEADLNEAMAQPKPSGPVEKSTKESSQTKSPSASGVLVAADHQQ